MYRIETLSSMENRRKKVFYTSIKFLFFLHLHDFKFEEIEALFCDVTITVLDAPYFRKYCDIHAIQVGTRSNFENYLHPKRQY